MTRRQFSASRRELLLGLGTIGVAATGAGIGSYAAFTDTEEATTMVTAGALDLTVHHRTNYNGRPADVVTAGTIDGEPGGLFDLPNVVPGDSGRTRFCFELESNPAYIWLCGALTRNAEMGRTDPEREVDDSGGDPGEGNGELADAIDVELKYADVSGNTSTTITSGTLREVLQTLSDGVPLDAAENEGVLEPGAQRAFSPAEGDGSRTEPCVVFEWEIPDDVGNEIQTDRVEFGLSFHARQARHSDGTNNPCDDTDEGGSGDGEGGSGDGGPKQKAISFVAFCLDDGSTASLEVTELAIREWKDGDEPVGISWATNREIDHVVVKAGPNLENFPGGTSGTATVGGGEPPRPGQKPSDPCPDGEAIKFEFDDGSDEFREE